MNAVDEHTHDRVRAVLRAAADATPIPERPALDDATDRPRRVLAGQGRRPRLALALAAAALVVVAGVVALARDDGSPDAETGPAGGSTDTTATSSDSGLPAATGDPVYGLAAEDVPAGFVAPDDATGNRDGLRGDPMAADIYELDNGAIATVVTGTPEQLAEALDDDYSDLPETPLANGGAVVENTTEKPAWVDVAVRAGDGWQGAIRANGATLADVLPLAERIADPADQRPARYIESSPTYWYSTDYRTADVRYVRPTEGGDGGGGTTGEVMVRTEYDMRLDPLPRYLADEEVEVDGHPAYLTGSGSEHWVTWQHEPGIVVSVVVWGVDRETLLDLAARVQPIDVELIPLEEEPEPGE